MFLVEFPSFALAVGTMFTSHVWAFVPVQPEPPERLENGFLGFGRGACSIGVLDTQDELTAMLSGEGEIEQRHVGCAYVRIASRRGCHPGANRTFRVIFHGMRRLLNKSLVTNKKQHLVNCFLGLVKIAVQFAVAIKFIVGTVRHYAPLVHYQYTGG